MLGATHDNWEKGNGWPSISQSAYVRALCSDLLTEVLSMDENALVQRRYLDLQISEAPQSLEVLEH